ncbi:MAG: hypothetical protein HYZ10_11215 [Ignavibacteriales bacterium]|nr:hypothetical protein [Ignavibacteriales bacterium]
MNQDQFQEIIKIMNSHSTIEIIYFISNIVIAIASLIALWNLILYKSEQHIRAKRESITIAASQVHRFCNEIIPQINKLNLMIKSKKLKKYTGKIIRGKEEIDNSLLEWILQYNDDELELFLNVINSLESLALYFVRGIADEEAAYYTIGKSFIRCVESYSPIVSITRSIKDSSDSDDLFILYDLWAKKSQRSELSKKVTELNESLNKIKADSIKPIGV